MIKQKRFSILVLGAVGLLVAFIFWRQIPVYAQQPGKYVLTEIQKLRLQVKIKDAQLAQDRLTAAQNEFRNAIVEFNNEVHSTEKENSWPDNLKVDPNTLDFSDAVKPGPPAAPATKPGDTPNPLGGPKPPKKTGS